MRIGQLRESVCDAACEFLERILLAELPSGDIARRDLGSGRAAVYSNLWGADFYYAHEVIDDMGVEWGALDPDGMNSDLAEVAWPFDFACATYKDDGRIFIERSVTVSPKDVRGLARIVTQRMLMQSTAFLGPKHDWQEADMRIIALCGDRWVPVDNEQVVSHTGRAQIVRATKYDAELLQQVNQSTGMTFSMSLTERYNWHVAFGFNESGPRVLLPTNPKGCISLFKTRDVELGESRRAALRHWVAQHYREKSTSEEDLVFVRQHLRGRTNFVWHGLLCEILVSEYDLERNEFFKQQADEWRSKRKHNQFKIRLKRWKT